MFKPSGLDRTERTIILIPYYAQKCHSDAACFPVVESGGMVSDGDSYVPPARVLPYNPERRTWRLLCGKITC